MNSNLQNKYREAKGQNGLCENPSVRAKNENQDRTESEKDLIGRLRGRANNPAPQKELKKEVLKDEEDLICLGDVLGKAEHISAKSRRTQLSYMFDKRDHGVLSWFRITHSIINFLEDQALVNVTVGKDLEFRLIEEKCFGKGSCQTTVACELIGPNGMKPGVYLGSLMKDKDTLYCCVFEGTAQKAPLPVEEPNEKFAEYVPLRYAMLKIRPKKHQFVVEMQPAFVHCWPVRPQNKTLVKISKKSQNGKHELTERALGSKALGSSDLYNFMLYHYTYTKNPDRDLLEPIMRRFLQRAMVRKGLEFPYESAQHVCAAIFMYSQMIREQDPLWWNSFLGSCAVRKEPRQLVEELIVNAYTSFKEPANVDVHCRCVGDSCQRNLNYYCRFCSEPPTQSGNCNGCGEIIKSGTHCCSCHGNPNFCPICHTYHESEVCDTIHDMKYPMPRIVVGCRKTMAKMGIVAYVLEATKAAKKHLDTHPYLFDEVSKYMLRLTPLAGNGTANPIVNQADGGVSYRDSARVLAKDGLTNFLTWVLSNLGGLAMLLGQATLDALKETCRAMLSKIITETTPLKVFCSVLLKTMMRIHIFENCPFQVALEILWDSGVHAVAGGLWKLIYSLVGQVGESMLGERMVVNLTSANVNHSVSAPTSIAATLLFYLTTTVAGMEADKMVYFARVLPLFERLLPDSADDVLKSVPFIKSMIDGDSDEAMYERTPCTKAFYDLLAASKQDMWDEQWQMRQLKDAYTAYQKEAMHFDREEKAYWARKSNGLKISDEVYRRLPESRMQTVGLLLWGEPGCGKTYNSDIILSTVFGLAQDRGWLPKNMAYQDSTFDIIAGMTHWDGVMYQKLFRMNDFMTKKALPGEVASEIFNLMKILDTAPAKVPAAEIKYKNMLILAWLLVVTSNFNLKQIQDNCEINNPKALERRFTHIYEVKAKYTFPGTGRMNPDDPRYQDMAPWDMCTFTDSRTGQEVDLETVVTRTFEEMEKRMNAPANEDAGKGLLQRMKRNMRKVQEEEVPIRIRGEVLKLKKADESIDKAIEARKKTEESEDKGKEEEPNNVVNQGFSDWFPGSTQMDNIPGASPGFFESLVSQVPTIDMAAFNHDEPVHLLYAEISRHVKVLEKSPDDEYCLRRIFMASVIMNECHGSQSNMMNQYGTLFVLNKDGKSHLPEPLQVLWDEFRGVGPSDQDRILSSDGTKLAVMARAQKWYERQETLHEAIGKTTMKNMEEVRKQKDMENRFRQVYNSVAFGLEKIKTKAADFASGGADLISRAKAQALAITKGIDLEIPDRYQYVSRETVNRLANTAKGYVTPKAACTMVLAFGLFAVCSRYRRGPVNQKFKPKRMIDQSSIDDKFNMKAVYAPQGYIQSISNNVVDFGVDGENPIGTALALSSNELIVPTHMLRKAEDDGSFSLRHAADMRWQHFDISEKLGDGGCYVAHTESKDWSLVKFTRSHIKYCGGKHYNKLAKEEAKEGFCCRVYKESGVSEMFGYGEPSLVSHRHGQTKYLHKVNGPSWMGLCGAVYVDSDNVTVERIIGIHVSGHMNGDFSFMAPIDKPTVDELRQQLDYVQSCDIPAEMEYDWKRGHCYSGVSPVKVHLPKSPARKPMRSVVEGMRKQGFEPKFGMAPLSGIGEDGKTPYQRSLDSSHAKARAKKERGEIEPLNDYEMAVLIEDLPAADEDDDYIEEWQDVIRQVNGHAGVDWDKSAGTGLGKKGDYMEDGELKPELVDLLEKKIAQMEAGKFDASWNGTTLKDETRPEEKIKQGKVRNFSPVNMDTFLVSKRFCEPMYRYLRRHGQNLGVHFETNPEKSAQMRKELFDTLGIGTDVEGQDDSHSHVTWENTFRLCLILGIFKNNPNHPLARNTIFGKLEPKNMVRWGCFMQEANAMSVEEGRLNMNDGKLASGSFLTAALNNLVQLMIKTLFHRKHKGKTHMFGDDSTHFFKKFGRLYMNKKNDPAVKEIFEDLKAIWARFGYKITSCKKDQPLHFDLHQNIPLCGRLLRKTEDGFTCPLEIDRIVKSVSFFNKVRPAEYSQTTLNFLVEICYWDKKTMKRLLKGMVWDNGEVLINYLPDIRVIKELVKAKNMGPLQEGIRNWMTSSARGFRKPALINYNSNIVFQSAVGQTANSDGGDGLVNETLVRDMPKADASMDIDKMNPLELTTMPAGIRYPVLERTVILKAGQIATTAAPGDVEFIESFPSAIIDTNPRMQAALENTAYLQYEAIEFMIELNVSSWHNGGIIIQGSPMARFHSLTGEDAITSACTGPYKMVNFQKNIDEGVATKRKITASMVIPFNRDIFGALSEMYNSPTNGFDFVNIRVMVLEMGAPSTQGALPYVVRARLINPLVVESSTSWSPTASVVSHAGDEEKDVVDGVTRVAKVASAYGTENTEAKKHKHHFAKGMETAGELMVGGCKPLVPFKGRNVVLGWGANMASGNGGDNSRPFSMTAQGDGVAPPVGGNLDPADFSTLCAIPSLCDRFSWINTTSEQTILWYGFASPWPKNVGVRSNFALLASYFMYWRADMVFHFEAFPNAYQTGTYMVVVDYRPLGAGPATFDDTNNLYRVFVDLEEGCSVTVTVPYVYYAPWRVTSDTNVPVITLYNVTQLRTNSGGASSVPFRVFYWAENVRFMWPFYADNTAGVSLEFPLANDVMDPKGKGKEVVSQMDATEVALSVPYSSKVILGPIIDRFATVTPEDYMLRFGAGEMVTSIKELLKRSYLLKSIAASGNPGDLFEIHDPSKMENFPDFWQFLIKETCVFHYGGYRYKLATNWVSNWTSRATWVPTTTTEANIMEPTIVSSASYPISELQLNATCQFPYRVIEETETALPRVQSTIDTAHGTKVYISVSDSYQLFGKAYMSQVWTPTASNNFKTQTFNTNEA